MGLAISVNGVRSSWDISVKKRSFKLEICCSKSILLCRLVMRNTMQITTNIITTAMVI